MHMSLQSDRTYRSPNWNARRGTHTPDMIVLHYTGMQTGEEAIARLCDRAAEVSAHYVIGERGELWQLVDDENRAWHAGVSCWQGERDINSRSIGIEIVNPGHEWGYRPFPKLQIDTVTALLKILIRTHGILPERIIGHSDIAPSRKEDPGELFPWQALAQEGIGVWPDDKAACSSKGLKDLYAIGYDPECAEDAVWRAFHRHFYPEQTAYRPTAESLRRAARLASLTPGKAAC